MILVGRYQSPFVRRVAISLRQLGLTYQHKPLSVIDDREAVKAINPLMRVPALVLEDGEVLIDSSAILDYIDERVGPARALIPPSGPERRKVLRLIALATGIMDKSVSYYQETRFRPEDKRHPGLLAYFTSQITQAFTAIEQLGGAPFLAGDCPTQADISVVAALDFAHVLGLELPALPRLDEMAARCNALPAFADTRA